MRTFRQALAEKRILFLDGAMGTMLQSRGLPTGMSPERFCLENPAVLQEIHATYLRAGSDLLTTCTFGGSSYKLSKDLDVFTFNRRMAEIARSACEEVGKEAFVAGNLGPSGVFLQPLGEAEPNEFIKAYVEQVRGLVAGGVDLFFIETQFDLAEARALVLAVRAVTDLPIMVSMTFEQGLSLTGSTPEIFAATMNNLGVDVLGTNCSLGPEQMGPVVESLLCESMVPVLCEPNAGLPILKEGKTVFPLDAERFAQKTAPFADLGVQILGGCCGTTPAHIAALVHSVSQPTCKLLPKKTPMLTLTSRNGLVRIGENAPFVLIGERINPTGKKQLTHELQTHSFTTALNFADEQVALGAELLDVNVGAPLVLEEKLLPELVCLLCGRVATPLSLDSSNTNAILAALPFCTGSFLVNSISGEGDRLQVLARACKRFGCPCILLPLQGPHLPETSKERLAILEDLLIKAEEIGLGRHMLLVDILALTVSSTPNGAKSCLEVLDFCRREGLATTLGLSNISFGLPARELVNATFLSMAAGRGLNSCIANPASPRVREALASIRLLLNQDPQAAFFIAHYAHWANKGAAVQEKAPAQCTAQSLGQAVLLGDKENVLSFVTKELEAGSDPLHLVQEVLIPAITEVGARYERREYYLPQLLRSAETMQKAFEHLKPLLIRRSEEQLRPVIIMATVEGDIHDIGKNIVSLLLSNHGFEVVDAGKDVPAKKIVSLAEEHRASLIGLSALMTTTMVRMEETIALVHKKKLPMKILVGGACVTETFAKKIGADAYCKDAVEAVRTAKMLLKDESLCA